MPRGALLTFEGIEGSGKTTQARRLAAALERRGLPVLLIREPGGTPLAERVRDLLLDRTLEPAPLAEAFLFQAARADVVERVVRPARDAGTVVVADRYTDASLAYQGMARGLGRETIDRLNALAVAGEWPDRTYVLDLPVEAALRRVEKRAAAGAPISGPAEGAAASKDVEASAGPRLSRLDAEPVPFHERVRAAYRSLAAEAPRRVVLLDGLRAADDLAQDILRDAEQLLTNRRAT